MEISVWQKKFAQVVEEKFPNSTDEERLLLLLGNVMDVHKWMEKYKRGKCTSMDVRHRIAAIFPDLFVLCESNHIDPDLELQKVMEWFERQDNRE